MCKINLKNEFIFAIFTFFCAFSFSKENYLLLSLDTVRVDRFSLYGYEIKTTPFLDSLKNEAIIFENAYSLVPLTFPSHVNILTGKNPFETGIFLNGQKIENEENLLPKIFEKKGYKTAAFVSSAILNKMFGLSDGFDIYSDVEPQKGEIIKERSCFETNKEVFKFLEENKENFFIWVHYFEPHSPYEPPEPFKSQFKDPYDGEIRTMDECIKELFEKIPENTLTVIAGDHGEMLGEHYEDEHGVLLYEPAIKVPLIVLKKGEKGKKVKEYLDLSKIHNFFVNFLEKKEGFFNLKEKKPVISASIYGRETKGFYPAISVIYENYKLINYGNREYLLFDLEKDPFEKNNIFEENKEKARQLKKILDKYPFPEQIKVPLKDEEKKVLTSLGYTLPKKYERLISPELGLKLEKNLKKAEKYMEENNYKEAEYIIFKILEEEPNYQEAKKLLGKLYLKTKQMDKAMGAFSSFAMGEGEESANDRARKKFEEGKYEEAIKIMEQEVKINPFPKNYGELAFYLYNLRNCEKIKKIYEDANSKKIYAPVLWSYMGLCLLKEKKLTEAEENFERALKINPKTAEAIKGKAILNFLKKDLGEALKHIEIYLGMNPKDWEGYYYKGLILKEKGKENGANENFQKAIELTKDEETKKQINSLKSLKNNL